MTLMLSTGGNLLLASSGLLANSLDCCCSCLTQHLCNDPVEAAWLPDCDSFAFRGCLELTLTGVQLLNTCQRNRATCSTFDPGSYKLDLGVLPTVSVLLSSVTPDLTVDPDDLCVKIPSCGMYSECQTLDSGVILRTYSTDDCTGTPTNAAALSVSVQLSYVAIGAQRRWILQVWLAGIAVVPIRIFFGTVNFDARNKASYDAFPLTIGNFADYQCVDCPFSQMFQSAGKNGTATLSLRCDKPPCA